MAGESPRPPAFAEGATTSEVGSPHRKLRPLPRSFYATASLELAPLMLNKVLVHGSRSGRIVEVEAYHGAHDPGSHAFRGETRRNRTMFGPPGHLYVYFTYGMHWCANVVAGETGEASAVLLRALAPISDLEAMRRARPKARRSQDLASGPAKLTQAMGIDGSFDGADLTDRGGLFVADDGTPPPPAPGRSRRIGLTHGVELPWRWFVSGDPNLSRPSPRP